MRVTKRLVIASVLALVSGNLLLNQFILDNQEFSNHTFAPKTMKYVVKDGDTLSGIARKFLGSESEWNYIRSLNEIKNVKNLQIGKTLQIPIKSKKGYYQIGIASWYGEYFHGRKTANGEIYDMYRVSTAHRFLPLGTKVKIINLENGKDIDLKINDRGPYIDGRIIDLSYKTAQILGIKEKGLEKVKIEVLNFPKFDSESSS